jgi:glutathione S-transferase
VQAMERYWLAKTKFVAGDEISIADLLLATEMEQLAYMEATDVRNQFSPLVAQKIVHFLQNGHPKDPPKS